MDSNHRKENFDEDLEEEKTSKVIYIDQIVASYKTSMNLMSQQAMILLRNHNHIVSQSLDYKSNKFVIS
jgi:hypothetical protein